MTEVAADPALCGQLLEWEHLADDFIASGSGMTALCAYAGPRLARDALADLASVHPVVHSAEPPPFRVWFDDDGLTLAGEVDVVGAERLGRVLASSPVRPPVAVLDLARVEFMDVSGCRAIAHWALELQDRGVRLVLLGASRLFRRMWTVLGFAETGAQLEPGDRGTDR
jgi:anti-anti-sigma factor